MASSAWRSWPRRASRSNHGAVAAKVQWTAAAMTRLAADEKIDRSRDAAAVDPADLLAQGDQVIEQVDDHRERVGESEAAVLQGA